jgi:hypothetical protein
MFDAEEFPDIETMKPTKNAGMANNSDSKEDKKQKSARSK